MTQRLVIDGSEITGRLREGIEDQVLAKTPDGHVGGMGVDVEEIVIVYRLRERRKPWGLSGYVRILPQEQEGLPGESLVVPDHTANA